MRAVKFFYISIIVLCLLYSSAWFGYSEYLKSRLTYTITGLNNTGKINFTYDEISRTGFPMNVQLIIKNPKADIKSGEIFKELFAKIDEKAKEPKFDDLPDVNWNDNFVYSGDWVVTSNILSTKFSIKTDGELVYNSNIDSVEYDVISKGEGTQIDLHFSQPLMLTVLKNKGDNDEVGRVLGESFEQFGVNSGKSQIVEKSTGELLQSSDGVNFIFSVDKKESKKPKADIIFGLKNAQTTKRNDELMAELYRVPFFRAIAQQSSGAIAPAYANLGKINADIHFKYKGSFDEQDIKDKNFDGSFEIASFNISNDLSKMGLKGKIKAKSTANKLENLVVKLKGSNEYNEKWYDYSIADFQKVQQHISELEKTSESDDMSDKATSSESANPAGALDRQKAIEITKKLFSQGDKFLPKLHEFGPITYDIDVKFNGEKQKLKINKFDISSDLYGVKIDADATKKQPMPDAKLSIALSNYGTLIDDLYSYTQKVMPILEDIAQKPAPVKIKETVVAALKDVLVKLSDEPQSSGSDVKITAVMNEQNPLPKIGTLSLPEAAILFQMTVAPHFEKIGPEADEKPLASDKLSKSAKPTPSVSENISQAQ